MGNVKHRDSASNRDMWVVETASEKVPGGENMHTRLEEGKPSISGNNEQQLGENSGKNWRPTLQGPKGQAEELVFDWKGTGEHGR